MANYKYYPEDTIAISGSNDAEEQFIANYRNPLSVVRIPIKEKIDWDSGELAHQKYSVAGYDNLVIDISVIRNPRFTRHHKWIIHLRIINNTPGWWEGDFQIPDEAIEVIKSRYDMYHSALL